MGVDTLVWKLGNYISPGVEAILQERMRQLNAEGWTEEHDDEHDDESLAAVAALYAAPPATRDRDLLFNILWPARWAVNWWKPSPEDRIKELIKAGALITAEIDRLVRKERRGRAAD